MNRYLFVEGYYDEVFVEKISEQLQIEKLKLKSLTLTDDEAFPDFLARKADRY